MLRYGILSVTQVTQVRILIVFTISFIEFCLVCTRHVHDGTVSLNLDYFLIGD